MGGTLLLEWEEARKLASRLGNGRPPLRMSCSPEAEVAATLVQQQQQQDRNI